MKLTTEYIEYSLGALLRNEINDYTVIICVTTSLMTFRWKKIQPTRRLVTLNLFRYCCFTNIFKLGLLSNQTMLLEIIALDAIENTSYTCKLSSYGQKLLNKINNRV